MIVPIASFPSTTLIACGLLLLTGACVWLRPVWLVFLGLCATVIVGYLSGILHGLALVWISLLGSAVWWYRNSTTSWQRAVAFVACVVITLLLGTHVLPGFSNPLLARDVVLADGAAPYTLYFNFDKTMAGVLLMAAVVHRGGAVEGATAFRYGLPLIAANVLVAMMLALLLGYVQFEPRWNDFFWLWALVNLMLTCFSEEAFFRGFLQRELATQMEGRRSQVYVPVIVSAVLFGLAHAAGGWRYVLLATVAGAGYAIVYQRTQRLEMAMLAHFAVNATHFLLFTYPYRG